MTKAVLHELVEQVKDDDIDVVVYVLSRFIRGGFEEDEPFPDEVEAIQEAEEAQARGERFCSFEEVVGKSVEYYRNK